MKVVENYIEGLLCSSPPPSLDDILVLHQMKVVENYIEGLLCSSPPPSLDDILVLHQMKVGENYIEGLLCSSPPPSLDDILVLHQLFVNEMSFLTNRFESVIVDKNDCLCAPVIYEVQVHSFYKRPPKLYCFHCETVH